MAKPSRVPRALKNKKFRPLYLGAIALVLVGGAFSAASTDLAYSAKSLMAAVTSTIDTTPRLTIVRNAYTFSGSMWPGGRRDLARFEVRPKYLTSYGYLRTISGTVHVNSKTAGLYVGDIGMRYETCDTWNYKCESLLVPVSIPIASTTSTGMFYYFKSSPTMGPLPSMKSPSIGYLTIYGTPYYGSIYTNPMSPPPSASVKAQIENASGAGQTCTTVNGVKTCKYGEVPVYTRLAYGNWLKVTRGTGFGYGYWDINNNGSLTSADADLVLKVAVGTIRCTLFKKCDINGSGSVTALDSQMLAKYANGSLPPPGASGLTVLSPNGGGYLVIGSTETIRWSGGSSNWLINVFLLDSTKTKTRNLALSVPNTGSFKWTVPTDVSLDGHYIRVSCQNCPTGTTGWTDDSDSYFKFSATTPSPTFSSADEMVEAMDGSNNDRGTFIMKYSITAQGGDIYISPKADVVAGTSITTGKTSAYIEKSGVRVGAGAPAVLTVNNAVQTAAGNFLIRAGSTAGVNITFTAQLPTIGTSGLYRGGLNGFSWGTSEGAIDKSYATSNTTFKTDYVSLN